MGNRYRKGLALACLLSALLRPSPSSAQIDTGTHGVFRSLLLQATVHPPDEQNPGLVAVVHVPYRPEGATSYHETWDLEAGGALLRPDSTLHIRPISESAGVGLPVTLKGPSTRVDAWSEEETFDASLHFVDIVAGSITAFGQGLEVGEIVQRPSGDDDTGASVGWIIEWTDSTGRPIRQEWWLTEYYTYPSMSGEVETEIRTLRRDEILSQGEKKITKRIVVEMSLLAEDGEPVASGALVGCAAGGQGGEPVSAALVLVALAVLARRRRSAGG